MARTAAVMAVLMMNALTGFAGLFSPAIRMMVLFADVYGAYRTLFIDSIPFERINAAMKRRGRCGEMRVQGEEILYKWYRSYNNNDRKN